MRVSREPSAAERAALESVAAEATADAGGSVTVYRIDLAALISKYVGETEKQLDLLLAEAEAAGAVLLVDESDALFGRRTEVEDSHDRYANIETNYLLARLEAYTGLVVVAANLRTTRDAPRIRRPMRIIDYPPR